MGQHDPKPDTSPKAVYLTEEQFAKIVELLTPGYEMAKLFLSQQPEGAPGHEPKPPASFDP